MAFPRIVLARSVCAALAVLLVGEHAMAGEKEGFIAAAPQDQRFATVTHQAMASPFEIILYPPTPDMQSEEVNHLAEPAFAAIDLLDARLSNWKPDSELSKVNREAADHPVEVGGELMRTLIFSREAFQRTHGIFDVTVGPLLDLWGFYRKEGHLPKDEEIKAALDKVGFDKVLIDESKKTVQFKTPGMYIDFGGIGKGLALDWAAQALRDQGVKSALLNAGSSSLVAIGTPPGEPGWKVRIRSPYNSNSAEILAEVTIANESLSSSSASEKFFMLEGKKYGHIFDPRTGKPSESGVLSATAIAPTGAMSEVLTKEFFVTGVEGTKTFCREHPEVRALLVVDEAGAPKVIRINL